MKLKDLFTFLGLASITAAVTLTSCDGSKLDTAHQNSGQTESDESFAQATDGDNISFVSFEDSIVIELPTMTQMFDKPSYATMYTSGVYPVSWGKTDLLPLQRRLMEVAYGTDNTVLNEAIQYYALHPSIVEDSAHVTLAPPVLLNDSTMSEQRATLSIESMSNDLLSMSVFSYVYPYGAAHGNYGTTCVNFYIPTGQVLDQSNIFDDSKRKEIIKVIRDAAKEQFASRESMVDISEINTYDNFSVTPTSIKFIYAPYEIAPYAAGEIGIEIEPYDLYDYLTPLGREVFGF